ncbi:MAG: RHS repeat-associated core domain-containing protein, partial [Ruminococcus sp.]
RARYYSPSTGRFISRDSFAGSNNDPLSLNLYTYFHNNHISGTDSTGYLMYAIYLQAIISIKIQPPKKGQFCPANSWAGLPFLFFLKQHTIRRNDRFCMLLFLLLCIRNKSTQNIYK